MTDAEFEKLVVEAVDVLPEKFRKLMENVVIVIEDDHVEEAEVSRDHEGHEALFGLYEGVPVTERGSDYSELPDKITIFKNTILTHYSDLIDIKECVENTVWHEIAHHFGFDEAWVEREEHRRGKTK